jgi:hypothetical protein
VYPFCRCSSICCCSTCRMCVRDSSGVSGTSSHFSNICADVHFLAPGLLKAVRWCGRGDEVYVDTQMGGGESLRVACLRAKPEHQNPAAGAPVRATSERPHA